MPRASNPASEIRRINAQVERLLDKRLELAEQLALPAREQKTIHDTLALANEITLFIEKLDGPATQPQIRKAVVLSRKMDALTEKLGKLPDTLGKEAASEAATAAVQRLLNEVFAKKA